MIAPSAAIVHVVGNACIDTTWTMVRFPMVGETLVATAVEDGLGGKGLNQAVAAARSGAAVRLWAAVGADDGAGLIRSRLAAERIDAGTLQPSAHPTDVSTILVDEAGDNMIVSRCDCATGYDPMADGRLARSLREGDMLVMQGNLLPSVTDACLALGRERGATTVLNPSPIARVAAMPWPLVDWAVLNRGEAEALTEKADLHAAARRLLAMGVRAVVITQGAQGALLMDGGGAVSVPAPRMPVVGTAGAGDVVCGIFAGLLSRGAAAGDAIAVAIAAASLSVSRPGTLSACPTGPEIAEMAIHLEGMR